MCKMGENIKPSWLPQKRLESLVYALYIKR
jgi:hypothetical protein